MTKEELAEAHAKAMAVRLESVPDTSINRHDLPRTALNSFLAGYEAADERIRTLESIIHLILDDPQEPVYLNQAAKAINYRGSFPGRDDTMQIITPRTGKMP